MRGKAWTKEEDEKLLREYKTKGAKQLQKELKDRTIAAIQNRYSHLTVRKPRKKQRKERKVVDKCPFCGSSRINKVDTWYNNVVEAYYCIDCLKEFLPNGKLIPPLYADGCEGW